MVFSIQWAGVSAAYVGMIFGAGMMWRAHAAEPFGPMKVFTVLVGLLFGSAASLPFVVSNFVAALLSAWLAQG